MARPVKPRNLILPQRNIEFIPKGINISKNDSTTLLSEEYEVIKLIDYENMNHQEAAKVLHISRPTVTRIYERARKKIAECLIELKTLKLEGGNSVYLENWFKCEICNSIFNIPDTNIFSKNCPVCSSNFVKIFHKE